MMNSENLEQLHLFGTTKNKGSESISSIDESSNYSKYIVYVDESGDHSFLSIDQKYPIFVLAFCVFHKNITVNFLYLN